MTDLGREFLARSGDRPAEAAPASAPNAIVPGRFAWVAAWDRRWYPAWILQVHGAYVLAVFADGLHQWVDARLVVTA
jgi:hypothetical protein